MAGVIGLRGMERGDDFEMATNVTDAGNFDDLVYTANGRRYCLQLKHTDNPDATYLQPKKLVKLLYRCFESYCEMGDKEKSEFIIYTNKRLGRMLSDHKRNDTADSTVESVFKTTTKGEIFNFTRDNKKIDVYFGVEHLVKGSKQFGDLSVPEQNYKVGMVTEFLGKLIMVIGQKGQSELDDVIFEEIQKRDEIKVGHEMYEEVMLHFKNRLEMWWRNKKKQITPETLRKWLQEAKTAACAPVVRSLFESCKQKIFGTKIKFSDSEVSRIQTELSDNRAVHLGSDALTLCSILLLDCLDTSKCIFVTFESLQSNKNMLLYAWLGGHWEWLIVFCDFTVQQSDISETCLEISEIIKHDASGKCIIILTSNTVQQISKFVPIEHKFNFEQLSKESQEMLLDKKIDFQGCELTMRSMLQGHDNVQRVWGPELVTDLITEGTAVNVGGKLQVNEGYYAPRTLKRNIFLHPDVLQNLNDIFVVSGETMEDLPNIVPSGKTVEYVSLEDINVRDFTQDVNDRIFVLLDKDTENCFLAIFEEIQGKPLHWLEFRNGEFLWKMSKCDTGNLLDYIDADKTRAEKLIIAEYTKSGSCEVKEDSIWDVKDRTVLVVAEPGMGKSSTTTQVAWHTKERDPASWVVRINWNDHTRKLQDIDTATFNFDSLVEFLCSAAFSESKYTDLERILLKQALQNSGNVTVLMDGFDEISPTHADKAAVILSELMKTKVGRVWVTSRPVEKERLEKELSVIAFNMKSLSSESQKEMLQNLWMSRAGERQHTVKLFLFIWKLLRSINRLAHDENFTGSPLYITMIATVYEIEMETHLNSENMPLSKIDLVTLYEKFVERKIQIYLTEKQKADTSNSFFQDLQRDLRELYFNSFQYCALVAILPPDLLELLKKKKIEEKVQKFFENIQAGGDKKGIVMNVVEGKPQFVHRTFGEFFTTHWFSRKFESNRSVLERILFDPEFGFVRDMFDRMLAKDCPLHCAVLEEDKKNVRTLLREGYDVNDVDGGGRTVMHIIAIHHSKSWDVINNTCTNEVSLDTRDCVLQWTPLQYAIKSQNWFIVERLLESKVEKSGLDMIKQRAHDSDYINSILRHCGDEEHVLLLEYLHSIGVNIPQASSLLQGTASVQVAN